VRSTNGEMGTCLASGPIQTTVDAKTLAQNAKNTNIFVEDTKRVVYRDFLGSAGAGAVASRVRSVALARGAYRTSACAFVTGTKVVSIAPLLKWTVSP
jgi:hypothetical protein